MLLRRLSLRLGQLRIRPEVAQCSPQCTTSSLRVPIAFAPPRAPLHTSLALWKSKSRPKSHKAKGSHRPLPSLASLTLVDGQAVKAEMEAELETLKAAFIAHLSLRFDIRTYAHLPILIDGVSHQLGQLAELRAKSDSFLEIVCPLHEYAKPIKEALEKSGLNLAPYIEHNTVIVPLPRVTRQRREELAHKAVELSQRAADAIRDVFKSYDRKVRALRDSGATQADEAEEALTTLLFAHKDYVQQTKDLAAAKQTQLLQEQL